MKPKYVKYSVNDSIGINFQSTDIVVGIFGTKQKDPQINKKMSSTMEYINNYYVSVKSLNLNAIIFHDNLTDQFVNKYTTHKITFWKVANEKCKSINNDYLSKKVRLKEV